MIEIRVLTPEDWMIWRELRLAALAETPTAFGAKLADWQGEGDLETRWRDRLRIPGGHDLVALLDGQPVGMVSGVPGDEAGTMELISMWVGPQARGLGVGDLLVTAVLDRAGAAGARTVRLRVAEDNRAAIALYARNSFRHAGATEDLMPDGERRELLMVAARTDSGK